MTIRGINTTMRVPRFMGQGIIDFVEKPVPEPGFGYLLIQIKANALCGSERGQLANGSAVTPGHEAAGVVVATGPGTSTPVGTPGVVFLMDFCGACRSCRAGATNQCLAKRADMGFTHDGGYGPYELIHETIFFPIDHDIPLADATLLLDVMGTSTHAIKRGQCVHSDIESLLITGAGPVGLGMLAMARLLFGPDIPVLIADIVRYRLEIAERLGGIPINLTEHDLASGVQKAGFVAVDMVIDTSGKHTARQAGLQLLEKRGVLVCVGHGENLTLQVSPDLIGPERAILGSEYFCFNELPSTLAYLHEHHQYLQQIITHRYPLEDIQQAFDVFLQGDTGKVIIEQ